MKANVFRFLSLGLLLALNFELTSCRRAIELEAPKPPIPGKVEVRDNVYVLDSIYSDQLISLSRDQLLFRQNPTVRGGRVAAFLQVSQLKGGDVLIGYPSSVAPNGFWAKITNVIQENTNIRISYTRPSFLDLFLNMDTEFTLNWASVKGTGGFEFPVKRQLTDNTSVEVTGTVNGEVNYDLKTEFQMVMVDGIWKRIRIETFLTKNQKALIDVEGTVAYSDSKNIVCQNLTRVPIKLGPLPVWIRPVARLDLKGKLALSGKTSRETIEIDNTASYRISYDGNTWSDSTTNNDKPTGRRLNAEIKGKAEVGVEGTIEGYFYQFFPVDCRDQQDLRLSIGLGLEGYLGIEGVCQQPDGLSVRSYIGLKEKLGLTAKLFDIEANPSASASLEADLFKWTGDPANKLCPKDSTSVPINIPNEVEEASTSVSTADPHMTTFDRGRYDFMAVGEFVAARSITDNFLVQVRQAPYPNSTQVSVNTGVAMQMGNNRICIYPGPSRLFVNNQTVPLTFTEYTLTGGGSIQNNNGRLSISNSNGDRVEVKLLTSDLDYFITPAKNRKGKLVGLFGNYDGNPSNDLVQADGKTIANRYQDLYPAFADNWRVVQSQSLFVYDAGKNTDFYTDKNFPRSEVQLTTSQRTAAEQVCRQAGVTDPDALEGCIVDVALTGNQAFAERAKQNEIVSNAKNTLSVSNFSQYRNEFTLSSGAAVNGSNVALSSKGIIRWNDAYLNREGYETEIVLAVNAPSPCFPLFDIDVLDTQTIGTQSFIRFSTNSGRTQIELVNSSAQPQIHPVNFFDGNRHRVRIVAAKNVSGSQTRVRLVVYIDNYEGV
ncbi:VWD domain-containing protein, partial [Spirosoma sp.]|uniref:VWD domain-containing protein n=1 Tax=Spirosoma sp. TaxID=1899569 RepID=UPI003B3B7BB9